MRKITFQIGVDLMGFPIYHTHTVYQSKPTHSKRGIDRIGNYLFIKRPWIKVESETVKQH